ncbi:hypothetical protein SCHPADRAFT_763930 [Schizopora paradoxa]|uniref:Uncharacterized protein n=1 Tax=Schizopora paradoxa TaxID=27342 RepID=A0A0H2QYJ1_9AGAM|nr:hypothetical protein SCHPADRAFT_763930 [Schizopora paradoxa]
MSVFVKRFCAFLALSRRSCFLVFHPSCFYNSCLVTPALLLTTTLRSIASTSGRRERQKHDFVFTKRRLLRSITLSPSSFFFVLFLFVDPSSLLAHVHVDLHSFSSSRYPHQLNPSQHTSPTPTARTPHRRSRLHSRLVHRGRRSQLWTANKHKRCSQRITNLSLPHHPMALSQPSQASSTWRTSELQHLHRVGNLRQVGLLVRIMAYRVRVRRGR